MVEQHRDELMRCDEDALGIDHGRAHRVAIKHDSKVSTSLHDRRLAVVHPRLRSLGMKTSKVLALLPMHERDVAAQLFEQG